ncbi:MULTISPECIES: ArsR/SmtB family transcription factor [Halorubrum]|uniref:ArsR/SmtB family transcription factor n=1 Tax=Halorubrum TaxID=56688 RepID=UPI0009B5C78E|nr:MULTISPECIES: winged helix-turn-helix domain-containing protein [Halorubrum]
MPTAFPYRTPIDHAPREQINILVNGEQSSNVLQTVSSDTAQQILATLDDEPATTSDIAEAIGTSTQNAKYHLDCLCEANIVEAVDTWYSRKGTEMTVYALSAEQLVVQFGGSIPETQR